MLLLYVAYGVFECPVSFEAAVENGLFLILSSLHACSSATLLLYACFSRELSASFWRERKEWWRMESHWRERERSCWIWWEREEEEEEEEEEEGRNVGVGGEERLRGEEEEEGGSGEGEEGEEGESGFSAVLL